MIVEAVVDASTELDSRRNIVVTVAEIREEVVGSAKLSDYEAVDVLWVALVKTANMHSGSLPEFF